MKLIKLDNIRHQVGHCYVADLPKWVPSGEAIGLARKSTLRLFEAGVQLGRGSASHEQIRSHGGGLYSHWGNCLYFSARDNSNPIIETRDYLCLVSESLEEEEQETFRQGEELATTPSFLQGVLSASLSFQGAELHSVFALRSLLMHSSRAGVRLSGTSCLEIGSSPNCGVAIALGLLGARSVSVNNIVPIYSESIDIHFARNIAMLTSLMMPTVRLLEDVVIISTDGRNCRLNPAIYTVLSEVDALDVPAYLSEVDFIFSISVLEHIRHLPEVMAALRRCASNDCRAIHLIDARDHTDFSNPLKYLYLDPKDFEREYAEDHNRWRFSDYTKIFRDSGWTVRGSTFMGVQPVLDEVTTDMFAVASIGPERLFYSDPSMLPQIISQDELGRLSPEFRRFSVEELSAVVFAVILQPN
jgi:hypothetical protein